MVRRLGHGAKPCILTCVTLPDAYLAVVVKAVVLRPGAVPGQQRGVRVAVPGVCAVPHRIAHKRAQPPVRILLLLITLQSVCSRISGLGAGGCGYTPLHRVSGYCNEWVYQAKLSGRE